ncbi:MAG TPA: type 4a pilus biogenesis protein PilO [Candidatus Binatia bacterium]|nr:type 4a pilus biogenesis protein PilO [Candidatus Binatia bacterium]
MQKGSASIIVFLLVIVVLAAGYFGTYGQWTTLGQSQEALDVVKMENEQLLASKAEVTNFVRSMDAISSNAGLADRALPKGHPDIPTLFDYHSRTVVESGLALDLLNIRDERNPELVPPANSIQSLDIDVTVVGTYEAFNNYLLRLQRSLRISDVVSVRIGAETTVGGAQTLKFDLTIRTYYQQ